MDLAQNGCLDIGQRNLFVCAAVFHHIPTVACTSGREGRSTNPAPALLFPSQLNTKQMKRLSNRHGYSCGHIIHVYDINDREADLMSVDMQATSGSTSNGIMAEFHAKVVTKKEFPFFKEPIAV